MIISRVRITNLHGYLSFDIPFNERLTFLTGMNGTGKTSVLRAIQGILQPSFFLLKQLQFDDIIIDLNEGETNQTINAHREGQKVSVNICGVGTIDLPEVIERYTEDARSTSPAEYYNNEVIQQIQDTSFWKWYLELPAPTILGVDRRRLDNNSKLRRPFPRTPHPSGTTSSFSLGVRDALYLIERAVREYAMRKNIKSDALKQSIMSESIKAILSTEEKDFNGPQYVIESIDEKAERIRSALKGIFDDEFNFDDVVDRFVTSYTRDTEISDRNEEPISEEKIRALLFLPTYSYSFAKLERLITIVEQYNAEVENSIRAH